MDGITVNELDNHLLKYDEALKQLKDGINHDVFKMIMIKSKSMSALQLLIQSAGRFIACGKRAGAEWSVQLQVAVHQMAGV